MILTEERQDMDASEQIDFAVANAQDRPSYRRTSGTHVVK